MILIPKPKLIFQGPNRVIRGGSRGSFDWGCRSANRYAFVSSSLDDYLSFRIIMKVKS